MRVCGSQSELPRQGREEDGLVLQIEDDDDDLSAHLYTSDPHPARTFGGLHGQPGRPSWPEVFR
jgi:hypothetical protein